MPKAEFEKECDVSAETLFATITDYDRYPEFVDGVKKVTTKKKPTGEVVCDNLMTMMGKEIAYTIQLQETPQSGKVTWSLLSSDQFRTNSGGWEVQALSKGRCKVKYWLEVDLSFSVPSFIMKGLIKSMLPSVVDSFVAQAKKRGSNGG